MPANRGAKGVCIVDTSVLCEILGVPGKCSDPVAFRKDFAQRCQRYEMVLPLTTVLETGNHIGQAGKDRFRVATAFAALVREAMAGTAPFTAHGFPTDADWQEILARFPGWAAQGSGLGDLSIVRVYEQFASRFTTRPVHIWSLDAHLSGYGQ